MIIFGIQVIILDKSAIWCSSCHNSNVFPSPRAMAGDEDDYLQSAEEGILEWQEEALNNLKCLKGEFPSLSKSE